MSEPKDSDTHYTCTSTEMGRKLGDVENVSKKALDSVYEEKFGHPVSDNPVVARIEREQAIARLAREGR